VSINKKHTVGVNAENLAHAYLSKQGLDLVTRNYRCPLGEIDLIMHENQTIVFIEVRYRSKEYFYSAIESIDRKKRDRIIKTGLHYQQSVCRGSDSMYRFDILTISGSLDNPDIEWIRNAFQLDH